MRLYFFLNPCTSIYTLSPLQQTHNHYIHIYIYLVPFRLKLDMHPWKIYCCDSIWKLLSLNSRKKTTTMEKKHSHLDSISSILFQLFNAHYCIEYIFVFLSFSPSHVHANDLFAILNAITSRYFTRVTYFHFEFNINRLTFVVLLQ